MAVCVLSGLGEAGGQQGTPLTGMRPRAWRWEAYLLPKREENCALIYSCLRNIKELKLSFRDYVSVLADVMSIFGVGGFFTWSFVRRSIIERDVADSGVSVFVWSVKVFICVLLVAILFFPAIIFRSMIVLVITGSYSPSRWIWSDDAPVAYFISYLISSLLFIPIVILSISSVLVWSFNPFVKFWGRFTRRAEGRVQHRDGENGAASSTDVVNRR